MKGLLTIGILCGWILSGCAGFLGPDFQVGKGQPDPRPSVDYTVKTDWDNPLLSPNPFLNTLFHREVKQALKTSYLFSGAEANGQGGDYRFAFNFLEDLKATPPPPEEIGPKDFCQEYFWTTLVFPCIFPQHFLLTVQVFQGEALLRQYQYRHRQTTIIWPPLIPLTLIPAYNPVLVSKRMIGDMLMLFIHDLTRDDLLAGIPKG